jgi:hypothetical protein
LTDTNTNEDSVNPNVNFLDGKRCPECGSYGPFEVVVSKRVLLFDNGTDDAEDGTTEYGEDAPTSCQACGHEAEFGEFDE